MLLELRREVGGSSEAEDVALQGVPAHLKVEWVAELGGHLQGASGRNEPMLRTGNTTNDSSLETDPCALLDAGDVQLHWNVEAVEEVAAKHQGVHGSVHGMDPAWSTHTHTLL